MKENEASIFDRTRYHFRNALVKGTFARITVLTIVAVLLCFFLGFILSLVPSPDGNLLTSIWNATLCALDGGTIAGMEANTGQKAILFIVTIVGIVFSSVLVGIVTTGIEERLEYMAHEGSKVLERRPHVLVLGSTPVTSEILRSLAQSYESGKKIEPIVVLEGDRDIVDVSKELDFELKAFTKINTIYRQGCPYSEDDLRLCSIERARAVLVTLPSDDEAVKTVLVCATLLQKLGRETPLFVICEEEESFDLLQKEIGERIHLVSPDRTLADAVDAIQGERPATQAVVAGNDVEVSDQTMRLLIAANDLVEREASDDMAIDTLLKLHSLCERRSAEGKPLEIVCMLYYEKNVDPAKVAGAQKTILVGRLLADKISRLIEQAGRDGSR